MLSIKDVTQETGLTARTLRFYEEMGLVCGERKQKGAVRCYHPASLIKIKKIVELKELLGFSLEEIKMFVEIEERCPLYKKKYESLTDPSEKMAMVKRGIDILAKLRSIAQKRNDGIEKLLGEIDQRMNFLNSELSKLYGNAGN